MTSELTATSMTPERFRAEFPALSGMVHLYSCSLPPRAIAHDAAFARMLDLMSVVGSPWPPFEQELDRARGRFAQLVGTTSDRVALLPDASTGAYQVASTIDWTVRPGLVTCDHEFPSLSHVYLAQRDRGAQVRHVGLEPDGSLDVERFLEAVDERTSLVSIPFASYRDGRRLPVAPIVARAREVGAAVLVDAYQAVGVVSVDVDEIGCDFLVAGSGKYLLGMPGIAYLYAREPAGSPALTGWFGRRNPFAFDTRSIDYASSARRYEVGTKGVPAAFAANAGFDLLGQVDIHEVERHVAHLTAYATERLLVQGERLLSPLDAEWRGAQVAIESPDPERLAEVLLDGGVRTSPRGHALRLAFHHFNSEGDVDVLCTLLSQHDRTLR